jgi:hypothetical protein
MSIKGNVLAAALVAALGGCSVGAGESPPAQEITGREPTGAGAVGSASSALSIPDFFVFPNDAVVAGLSVTRWTEQFWRWLSSVPAAQNPDLVLGVSCGVDQTEDVFFVPPFMANDYTRTCKVQVGRPVLVLLQAVLNSFPCPDPTFHPAPGQTLQAFLQQGAVAFVDTITGVSMTVDGEPIDIPAHRVTSPLFINDVTPSIIAPIGDPCLTGSPQPAVSDGWFVMLLLTPGQHDVHMLSVNPDGSTDDRTVVLDVEL